MINRRILLMALRMYLRIFFNTTSSAGVNLGMTIFEGFSIQTTYKKLNELKQVGELNTQFAIENLIADIVSGYIIILNRYS